MLKFWSRKCRLLKAEVDDDFQPDFSSCSRKGHLTSTISLHCCKEDVSCGRYADLMNTKPSLTPQYHPIHSTFDFQSKPRLLRFRDCRCGNSCPSCKKRDLKDDISHPKEPEAKYYQLDTFWPFEGIWPPTGYKSPTDRYLSSSRSLESGISDVDFFFFFRKL